jgi:hypothetical protein
MLAIKINRMSRPEQVFVPPDGSYTQGFREPSMSDHFIDVRAHSLAEKRASVAKIVEQLGPNATAKQIREVALRNKIGKVDARLLSEIRNAIHPHRKRDQKESKYQIVEVGTGEIPACPCCGNCKIKVGQLFMQDDGKGKRICNCLSCKTRFMSLEIDAKIQRKSQTKRSELARKRSSALTEKQCTKCGFILSVELFSKIDRDFYRPWCRECLNSDRSDRQFQKNLRDYGLTFEQYKNILDSQGGGCFICGKQNTHPHGKVRMQLVFDHDHKTGAFRGLICQTCNRGLGLFGDNIESVEKAVAYLRLYLTRTGTV